MENTQILNDAKSKIGFIALSDGNTFYQLDGPEQGPTLVIVHGATVGLWEFDRITPYLAAAGYRVLRYDLFGHGNSALPDCRYDLSLFIRQCCELMEALAVPDQSCWLAHSMGAAITAGVLSIHPGWSRHTVMTAPMLNFSRSNPFRPILRIPGLNRLFMRFIGMPYLLHRRKTRYQAIGQPRLAQLYAEQFGQRYRWRAMLGIEQDGALDDQSAHYRALEKYGGNLTVLWGTEDKVIPQSDIDQIRSLMPEHNYVVMPKLQHNMVLAAPEQVAKVVLKEFST